MRIFELKETLKRIIASNLKCSVMLWGAPGIGKSSVVAQVAKEFELPVIDLRLSQLAPTDLRGLPVADNGVSRWYPPEFLPREGEGILFLDEINLAPPVMQGMAQQLILDRRVGSYILPDGWFVWAAGNRKEDRGSTFDMPSPLGNRFLHFTVEPNLDDFKEYAYTQDCHNHILAFLSFRPELLHKIDPQSPAWPSPRSWMMASDLLDCGISSIAGAVGNATDAEFRSFVRLQEYLPDTPAIVRGQGDSIEFPQESSVAYALIGSLLDQAMNDQERGFAFAWIALKGSAEWLQRFITELDRRKLKFEAPADPRLREALLTAREIVS